MPSFTSNFDIHLQERLVPPGNWLRALVLGSITFLSLGAYLELRLAIRGFQPGIVDTDATWARQRTRASDLGKQAIILVGASRIQLDVDLDVVRQKTDLEPVQLALDGSSFMPILEGLANDPSVTGTVVIDYQDSDINSLTPSGQSAEFEKIWERQNHRARIPTFASMEAYLSENLRSHLRSYADGARPLSSLLTRVLDPHATPQYIVTLLSRTRLADYKKVRMPDFYLARVRRDVEFEAGRPIPIETDQTTDDVEKLLQAEISKLSPAPIKGFDVNTQRIASMVAAIEKRGGRVVFVVMPTTGLVEEIVDKAYPRDRFLDRFKTAIGARTINVADFPALSKFWCPDGSHLDYRDRRPFTEALVNVLEAQHAL